MDRDFSDEGPVFMLAPILAEITISMIPDLSRTAHRLAAACAVALLCPTLPAAAQTETPDTRLRLDQELDRQRIAQERKKLEEADPLDGASAIVIDGQTYAVGNTVDEMGKALYIAVTRRQWPDARRFLAAYQKLEGHDATLVLYAKGALARSAGDLGMAEQHYRQLLTLNAQFLPGQLELARVLFENRKDREARRTFEQVHTRLETEGQQAQNVLRTVDAFLGALKKRRGWQGSFAIGPKFSTNLNQSSASYTCLLASSDGSCLFERKVPDAIKAYGLRIEGALNRQIPLVGHHYLRARSILFGDIYPGNDEYSQATLITRFGYQYQTGKNSISLSPSFDLGALGSSILYDAWGANADWQFTPSRRVVFRLEGNFRNFRYRQRGFTAQDGPLVDANLTAWYTLSPNLAVFGGPDALFKDTPLAVNSYTQWGGRLGVNKAFGKSASLLLMGSYRHRDYHAYSDLFAAQRKDDQINTTAVARFPALKFAGLIPEVSAEYTRVKSNIDWLYSFKRMTASFRLNYAF